MGKSKHAQKYEPVECRRQRFSKAFKLAAIGLLKQGQKPATQIALELGIRRNQLYKWATELEENARDAQAALNGSGRKPISQQSEIERLRREVARLTKEGDILKKGAAYFAKELPQSTRLCEYTGIHMGLRRSAETLAPLEAATTNGLNGRRAYAVSRMGCCSMRSKRCINAFVAPTAHSKHGNSCVRTVSALVNTVWRAFASKLGLRRAGSNAFVSPSSIERQQRRRQIYSTASFTPRSLIGYGWGI
jgi:transposase